MMRLPPSILALCLALSASLPASAADVEQVRQYINAGNAFMRSGRFAQSIGEYEQALKADPGNLIAKNNIAEAHNNWGVSYFNQHKYKEALAEWHKCLELSPHHTRARNNINILNRILAQQGVDIGSDEAAGAANASESLVPKSAKKEPDESDEALGDAATLPGGKPAAKPSTASAAPAAKTTPVSSVAPHPEKTGDGVQSYPDSMTRAEPPSEPHAPADAFGAAANAGKAEVPQEAPPSDSGTMGAVQILNLRSSHSSPSTSSPNSSSAPYSPAASGPPAAGSSSPVPGYAPAAGAGNGSSVYPPVNTPPAAQSAPPPSSLPAYMLPPGGEPNIGSQPTPSSSFSPPPPQNSNTYTSGASIYHPVNPTYPVLPRESLNDHGAAPLPGATPPAVPSAAPYPVASGTAGGSVEEQLTALEMKIMGQRHNELTVMQRLEKIEQCTAGQARGGTVIERINALRREYGI